MDAVDEILEQWQAVRNDLDLKPMGLVGRISRVSHLFSLEMNKTFQSHGLNASSFDVLATLRRAGPPYALSAGALMRSMMISSGSTTNRIQRLVNEGLVDRTIDAQDARKVLVQLTAKGKTVIEAAVTDHVQTQAGLIEGLSKRERTALERVLRRLEAQHVARTNLEEV